MKGLKWVDISFNKGYADAVKFTYSVVKLVPASIDGVFGVSNVMATYKCQE